MMKFLTKFLLVGLFFLSWAQSVEARKFVRVSGNGGISPNGEWHLGVENVYLGPGKRATYYVKFELVNLPKNKLKAVMIYGKKDFTYSGDTYEKARPDFILYVKDMVGARDSDVIWDAKSENVTVYFDQLWYTNVFSYSIKNKSFKLDSMDSKKYRKLKKTFRTISGNDGLFYIIPGSLEDSSGLCFDDPPKECKPGSVTFSVKLSNNSNKKTTFPKWDKKNIFNNFTIIAKDRNDRGSRNSVSTLSPEKTKKTDTFEKLDLSPKENKLFKVPVLCSLLPGKYEIQIYLTHYPVIHTEWHTILVEK